MEKEANDVQKKKKTQEAQGPWRAAWSLVSLK